MLTYNTIDRLSKTNLVSMCPLFGGSIVKNSNFARQTLVDNDKLCLVHDLQPIDLVVTSSWYTPSHLVPLL